MAEEKIVILGGRGMLGSDLAALCQQRYDDVAVYDLPDFDITDQEQLRKSIKGATAVINCAAYTNVDKAESESELAHKVNAEAVGRLGTLAKEARIWVLHISTDFVFDGQLESAYVETDQPNPISSYGRSKLAGEQFLVESGCSNCIMRVEWTYGANGNNFVQKLMQRAKTDGRLKVVDDQTGSPTATTEVAKAICNLMPKRPEGLYHFAADGYVSRYDMARFILDKLVMDVELTACKTSDFISPAARPLNSRFDCSKISALLDKPIESWQGPLEHFLGQL
jgi:dTDP-4-dehydrorhamnose reductase